MAPCDSESTVVRAPEHLNRTGCCIKFSEGKGRGVFATCDIEAHTVVEISPVLLFTATEYEEHGRHTVLDHYTFKWRDGRMALALGLGSIFNHSQSPNVSWIIDTATESIRYITTRRISTGEELNIFYGHKLWFDPVGAEHMSENSEEADDGWGGLSVIDDLPESDAFEKVAKHFEDGDPNDVIPEEELPFVRLKVTPEEEEEEELEAVRTRSAWVVDIPDPKFINVMLKWLKQSGLESPSMAHLKRIRKHDSKTTLLLAFADDLLNPPELPDEIELPTPYQLLVPQSSALTMNSLKLKLTFWPTLYTPSRKSDPEPWTRGKVQWACEALKHAVSEANKARNMGELPIAAYVPIPYEDEIKTATQLHESLIAHDTRAGTAHPLRHSVLNVIRAVADYRAPSSPDESLSNSITPILPITPEVEVLESAGTSSSQDLTTSTSKNGSHYLLTSLTLFTTHEPCIMCSMALLHSRVREVFYIVPMAKTGGCGSVACIPALRGVNHRFGISRWMMGTEEIKEGLEVDTSVDA